MGRKAGPGNSGIPFKQAGYGEMVCGEGRGGKLGGLQGHTGNMSGGRAMMTHRAPASSQGAAATQFLLILARQKGRLRINRLSNKSRFARFSNAGSKCKV